MASPAPDTPKTDTAQDGVPPVELRTVKQGHRSKVAAGLWAVEKVAKFGIEQSGIVNTVRTALKLNQEKGFDCQSCAWPNPDKDRSIAEFCENGFKAVAYEATHKLADPEFFKKHSVEELLRHSDLWLGEQGRLSEPMVLRPGATHYEPISWADAFADPRRGSSRPCRAPTRPSSTPRAGRATRPPSSTSSSSGPSAPTTCPTARTCATSRPASRCRR
jgi:hypothetical protein